MALTYENFNQRTMERATILWVVALGDRPLLKVQSCATSKQIRIKLQNRYAGRTAMNNYVGQFNLINMT